MGTSLTYMYTCKVNQFSAEGVVNTPNEQENSLAWHLCKSLAIIYIIATGGRIRPGDALASNLTELQQSCCIKEQNIDQRDNTDKNVNGGEMNGTGQLTFTRKVKGSYANDQTQQAVRLLSSENPDKDPTDSRDETEWKKWSKKEDRGKFKFLTFETEVSATHEFETNSNKPEYKKGKFQIKFEYRVEDNTVRRTPFKVRLAFFNKDTNRYDNPQVLKELLTVTTLRSTDPNEKTEVERFRKSDLTPKQVQDLIDVCYLCQDEFDAFNYDGSNYSITPGLIFDRMSLGDPFTKVNLTRTDEGIQAWVDEKGKIQAFLYYRTGLRSQGFRVFFKKAQTYIIALDDDGGMSPPSEITINIYMTPPKLSLPSKLPGTIEDRGDLLA